LHHHLQADYLLALLILKVALDAGNAIAITIALPVIA
jgi:hypothetical protein